jgi:hypothetical protein
MYAQANCRKLAAPPQHIVAALQTAHATAKTFDLLVLSASQPTGMEMQQ